MDPRTRELLSQASTATITTQLLARGLRNTFLHGIKTLNNRRLIGPAFTLRYIPAREDIDVLAVFKDYEHPQRKAIESVPPGHVLVMDCRGQGRAASAGGILATRLQIRRLVATPCSSTSGSPSPRSSRPSSTAAPQRLRIGA